jgi:heme exporter protein CcmD
MDFSAPHLAFVLWSYAITFVVLGGLALWIFSRNRSIAKRLEQLEAEGADRRRKSQSISQ